MQELFKFTVSELASTCHEPLPASHLVLTRAASLANPHEHSVFFVKSAKALGSFDLTGLRNSLILVPSEQTCAVVLSIDSSNVVAPVANPRLSFARIMRAATANLGRGVRYVSVNGATVAESVDIPQDCVLEPGAFIDHDVTIGARVRVLAGATIRAYTEIGDGSVIREGAVVGSAGFGFERDEEHVPIRLPHYGGVRLGMDVEIGALAAVCAGTIDPTVIEDSVKIANFVQIAHNVVVRRGTMIAGGSVIGGSTRIGSYTWISPNSTVLESRHVGDHATVGAGAVLLRDIEDGDVVFGNPARSFRGILGPGSER